MLDAGGAAAVSTAEKNETTRAGYAKLAVNSSSTTPYGTAVFGFKQNGATVTEAGGGANGSETHCSMHAIQRRQAPEAPKAA
jgi:hypothetical protein